MYILDFPAADSSVATAQQRESVFHCCYVVSDDGKWLVSVVTDERGELLETLILEITKFTSTQQLLSSLWNFCKQILHLLEVIQRWNIVMGKFGDFTLDEIQGMFFIQQLTE